MEEPEDRLDPIRGKDELYPHVSHTITHEIAEMLFWTEHYDRITWAVKTTQGRIIVVMQQRHEEHPGLVGGQVELVNAPFPCSAVKGLSEDILDLRALHDVLKRTPSF